MKTERERVFIKVGAQLTSSPSKISLLAEENITPFKKGELVKRVDKKIFIDMVRPLRCEIITVHNGNRRIVPVTYVL